MRLLTILIIIISIPHILTAQKPIANKDNWEKILINDYGSECMTSWFFDYEINRENLSLVLSSQPDSIIKKVSPELIESLFESFSNPEEIALDPLLIFGKDSTWFITNALSIWKKYRIAQNKKADSIISSNIKNYAAYKNALSLAAMQKSTYTENQYLVKISVITKDDTISFLSMGADPYMLPWLGLDGIILNYKLSETIGKILPDSKSSNKKKLLGYGINNYLINRIYSYYIEKKVQQEQ